MQVVFLFGLFKALMESPHGGGEGGITMAWQSTSRTGWSKSDLNKPSQAYKNSCSSVSRVRLDGKHGKLELDLKQVFELVGYQFSAWKSSRSDPPWSVGRPWMQNTETSLRTHMPSPAADVPDRVTDSYRESSSPRNRQSPFRSRSNVMPTKIYKYANCFYRHIKEWWGAQIRSLPETKLHINFLEWKVVFLTLK